MILEDRSVWKVLYILDLRQFLITSINSNNWYLFSSGIINLKKNFFLFKKLNKPNLTNITYLTGRNNRDTNENEIPTVVPQVQTTMVHVIW